MNIKYPVEVYDFFVDVVFFCLVSFLLFYYHNKHLNWFQQSFLFVVVDCLLCCNSTYLQSVDITLVA